MIVPDTQHFMAKEDEGADTVQPVDHSPIVTAPGLVVDVISGALRGVGRRPRFLTHLQGGTS